MVVFPSWRTSGVIYNYFGILFSLFFICSCMSSAVSNNSTAFCNNMAAGILAGHTGNLSRVEKLNSVIAREVPASISALYHQTEVLANQNDRFTIESRKHVLSQKENKSWYSISRRYAQIGTILDHRIGQICPHLPEL